MCVEYHRLLRLLNRSAIVQPIAAADVRREKEAKKTTVTSETGSVQERETESQRGDQEDGRNTGANRKGREDACVCVIETTHVVCAFE